VDEKVTLIEGSDLQPYLDRIEVATPTEPVVDPPVPGDSPAAAEGEAMEES
jgi:hypothetical protein